MSPDSIFRSCDDIRKLIANNYYRLQKRREQEALLGISVDPSIPLEIEIIEEKIRHLQVELKSCEDDSIGSESPTIISKLIDDTNLKQQETPIWPIPIITGFTHELDPISEETIQDYTYLHERERKDANYFGLVILEDGMKGDGIFPKDIVLIRQQPTIKLGEIAAFVIRTPKIKLGVLRRYYIVYEKRKKLAHWLLEASNPTSKHLIVMPSEVDINAVQELYAAQIQAGRIQLYADAELVIAGKYVGVVKKN